MKKRFQRRVRKLRKPNRIKAKDNSEITSMNYGGLINPLSGVGTSIDKNSQSFFAPTRITARSFNEILYIESWAAAKFVDIPVDDMFVKWRDFEGMENKNIKLVERIETEFGIKTKLSRSMKNGRLYGTGLFIILTKEAMPDKPLNINRLMPGDLANILTVDRFDATILEKERNPYSKNYGKPILYRINLKRGGSIIAHHSRVVRFDGKKPLSDNSWSSYDEDWGIASIIPVITEILQDSNVSKGVAHLVNEASIAVQKVDGFEDALSGSGDEMSLQDRMEATTLLRSICRTLFMDSEDTFERHDITFAGLPDIIDKNASRLAAAADIPETRFWGKSAQGMNATGDGDARNYALKVASDQENILPEPLGKIDSVIEKHLGLTEKIKYKFVSLLDLSEKDKTEVALKKSQIVVPLITAGILDEDEGRSVLDGDDIIGNLDDLEAPIPGADSFRKNLAAKQIERFNKEGITQ